MTKKFLCVQGSPEIPKDAVATQDKPNTLYLVHSASGDLIGGYKPWQIEGNSCWEEVKEEPAGRWQPGDGDTYYSINRYNEVSIYIWNGDNGDIYDKKFLNIGNVYRTREEAEDEVKRRESIAKAWWPEEDEDCYIWFSADGEARADEYNNNYIADAYIGAIHPTKEACEQWGKEYGHLFDKRPAHGK